MKRYIKSSTEDYTSQFNQFINVMRNQWGVVFTDNSSYVGWMDDSGAYLRITLYDDFKDFIADDPNDFYGAGVETSQDFYDVSEAMRAASKYGFASEYSEYL